MTPNERAVLDDFCKARHAADYDAAISFTIEEAREVIDEAERFADSGQ